MLWENLWLQSNQSSLCTLKSMGSDDGYLIYAGKGTFIREPNQINVTAQVPGIWRTDDD